MNLAQKVAVNTIVQIAGRIVVLALGLVTLRLTTTYLGVASFGSLAIVISLTGLLATVADLGVTTTLARELAKDADSADHLGGMLLRFRLASAGIAAMALAVCVPFLPYDATTKAVLWIGLVGMIFNVLGTFPSAFFQTNLRLDYSAAVDILSRLLGLGAILVVRGLDLGLYSLVALIAVANAVSCASAFALSRRFWRINVRFEWRRARPLIRDSVLIGLVSSIGLLHFRGDAILLSLLRPAGDVGIYAVAYRFVDQAVILPGMLMAAMFPIITRAVHAPGGQAVDAINRTFQALLLSGIAMTMFLYVLAAPLVHLVAGSGFDRSIRPLHILAFAISPIFVAPVFYNVLIAINRQRDLVLIGLVSLGVNVALNLVLIPRYSYNGAAAATVFSEAFSLAGSYIVARRLYSFRLDRLFPLRAMGAAGIAVAALAAVHPRSPWVELVVAESVFCAGALALRAVTRADIELVLRHQNA